MGDSGTKAVSTMLGESSSVPSEREEEIMSDEESLSEPCCDNHEAAKPDLFYCSDCNFVFCDGCSDVELRHRKLKRTVNKTPHEKTDLWLARFVKSVFSNSPDPKYLVWYVFAITLISAQV
jgi:hypothetical protein